ncbi:MAG: hypothetical protein E7G15_07415 [Cutibacterium avidum]|nr:hypothetical protein [Cutibacterium avidum]MDU5300064.1 hypothetical protein [Cutibacterium avidum]MDU5867443.1 hypothetical protein [Cutibacterium avidum]MDU8016183.1 hypothetical protein [Cutibacterium avidum]
MSRTRPTLAVDPVDRDILDRYGKFITYRTASEITSLSVRTLRRMTDRGDLPAYSAPGTNTMRVRTVDVLALQSRVA